MVHFVAGNLLSKLNAPIWVFFSVDLRTDLAKHHQIRFRLLLLIIFLVVAVRASWATRFSFFSVGIFYKLKFEWMQNEPRTERDANREWGLSTRSNK